MRAGSFIRKGWRVTVINPSPYLYYSGMGPGMLSGLYSPEQIRFNVREIAESGGGTFIPDSAVKIDPHSQTVLCAGGSTFRYDIASCNVGSVMLHTFSGGGMEVFNVKPIENLLHVKSRIMLFSPGRQMHIVVAGGGAAGVEIAGNAWKLVTKPEGLLRLRY
jgi:NADH dehydrogenase FAD-containing subunit